MAFGGSEGFANPPQVTPELEHWFAQIQAEIKEIVLGSGLSLDDLGDVVASGASSGDFLRHDGSNWVNETIQAGDIIEAAVTQHEGALAIAFTQLTGSIANGQVPESAITQHESALTILESQITDGSILARLAAAETVTGAWTFNNNVLLGNTNWLQFDDAAGDPNNVLRMTGSDGVKLQNPGGDIFIAAGGTTTVMQIKSSSPVLRLRNATGELLRLDDSSATGSPRIGLYRDGTLHARFQFNNSGSRLYIVNDAAGIIRLYTQSATHTATFDYSGANILFGSGDERLRMEHASADGNPYLSFYQSGTRRGYLQYNDSENSIRITNENNGAIFLRTDGDEIVRLRGTTNGNPYLSFAQAGTRRAWIRLDDAAGPSLEFRNIQSGRYSFMTSADVEFVRIDQSTGITVDGATLGPAITHEENVTGLGAAVSDGDSRETNITVSGATVGDAVAASTSLSDVQVSARVASANTVYCIFTNHAGASKDMDDFDVFLAIFNV